MSFQGSLHYITRVNELATALLRECKVAGDDYFAIAGEVGSLRTVLGHLKDEADAPDSLVFREYSKVNGQLIPIIEDCHHTLQQVGEMLRRHGKLAHDTPVARTRLTHSDVDSLNDLRMKLETHKSSITAFLNDIQLEHSGCVPKTLNLENNEKEALKDFRKELSAEGFLKDFLQENKDVPRVNVREIESNGLLTENPPTSISLQDSVTSKLLEPGAMESQESTTTRIGSTEGPKELAVHEDNMVSREPMKGERARPHLQDASRDIQNGLSALNLGTEECNAAKSVNIEEVRDDLRDDESGASPRKSRRSILPTCDLGNRCNIFTDEQTFLQDRPLYQVPHLQIETVPISDFRISSPVDVNSQVPNVSRPGSAPSDERHTADSLRLFGYTAHPPSPRRSFEPVSVLKGHQRIAEEHSRSPRSVFSPLAPDSRGNPISPDAKWTKIKRSLVSPEVLAEDGHRYEARPDFVAVLGVLSHEEIEELAFRSRAVREARRQRSRETPRPPPSRKAPQNFRYRRRGSGRHDTSSDESSSSPSSSSSSDSDEQYRARRRKKYARKHRHEEDSYTYPPYTPPPLWSPTSPPPPGSRSPGQSYASFSHSPNQGMMSSSQLNLQQSNFGYAPQPYIAPDHPTDYRGHMRRNSDSARHQSRGKDVKNDTPRSRGWRENLLLGAGIGGAAGSLLSVLSEAAAEF